LLRVPVMNRVAGTITVVQEERFQLACDDGVERLFILSHDAPLEAEELSRLKGEGVHVEVLYDDRSNLIAHTAHGVRVQ